MEVFPFFGAVCVVEGGDCAECCFSGVFSGWIGLF